MDHALRSANADQSAPHGPSNALTIAFAIACGAMVANLYYAQPMIGLIAPDIGMSTAAAGLIVTLTQLGYGAGLLLIVPMADLFENRKLVLVTLAGTIAGLIAIALSTGEESFLIASFITGFFAVGAQVLVPFAAHLAPEQTRGRMIGNVMGGLLAGIMLARPLASITAAHFGWRAIFWLSAVVMAALGLLLARALPRRKPQPGAHYGQILLSMLRLLATTPVLRRRAAYQALMFAAFNLFWTAVPLMLMRDFGYSQKGVALFALAGAGGALAAPFAGRLADRGLTRIATGVAILVVILSFLAAGWAGAAGLVVLLALCAITLDAAVQTNQVLGQRLVYALPGEVRGRINAIYMTIMFLLGSCGSAVAAAVFQHGGWHLTVLIGVGTGLMLLALFATELTSRHRG